MNETRKTGSHLRVRNDCHVSALSGPGRDSFVKNFKSEELSGIKIEQKEKKYSALIHMICAPLESYNLNLAFCDTDTYANQSLYTNLVNNFVRFRGERVCTINLKTLMKSFLSFNNS